MQDDQRDYHERDSNKHDVFLAFEDAMAYASVQQFLAPLHSLVLYCNGGCSQQGLFKRSNIRLIV
jgi:hypothetical protein